MKTIILIISIVGLMLVNTTSTEYCKGWKEGYKEGWCYERVGCVKPIPPVCPVATVNCPKGYKCGYNRGFSQALKDRK